MGKVRRTLVALVAGAGLMAASGAMGILPLGNQFSLFGKVGLLVSDVDVSVNVAGFPGSDSESETGLHFGIGALFDVSRNVGIRAEWERNDELELDMISVGVQVRF